MIESTNNFDFQKVLPPAQPIFPSFQEIEAINWDRADTYLNNIANVISGIHPNFQMIYGGVLTPTDRVGIEMTPIDGTLQHFRARRGVAGTSGTTIIELQINGGSTGYTLSWPYTDSAFALKTVSINQLYTTGDMISFKIHLAEINGEDIYAETD